MSGRSSASSEFFDNNLKTLPQQSFAGEELMQDDAERIKAKGEVLARF